MKTRMAVASKTPEIDLQKRILRQVIFLTDRLASDGGIVLMDGVDLAERYLPNPIVQAKHAMASGTNQTADVIGRSIEILPGAHEIIATVQFADTALGRDYAYLYGVNPEKEVYMRAWSAGFNVLESEMLSGNLAQKRYPEQWDSKQFEMLPSWLQDRIEIDTRTMVTEFSAVARGADRNCLTRAANDGCKTAGELIARVEFDDLREMFASINRMVAVFPEELARLNRRLLAIEGKGASAALDGDTDELRAELCKLTEMARR